MKIAPTPASRFADVDLGAAGGWAVLTDRAAGASAATGAAPTSDASPRVADTATTLRVHYLRIFEPPATVPGRGLPGQGPPPLGPPEVLLVHCFHGFGASSLSFRPAARGLVRALAREDAAAAATAAAPVAAAASAPAAAVASPGSSAGAALRAAGRPRGVALVAHDRCGFGLTGRPPLHLRATLLGGRAAAAGAANPYSSTVDAAAAASIGRCARSDSVAALSGALRASSDPPWSSTARMVAGFAAPPTQVSPRVEGAGCGAGGSSADNASGTVVVGHSMGALAAARLASSLDPASTSLILVAPAIIPPSAAAPAAGRALVESNLGGARWRSIRAAALLPVIALVQAALPPLLRLMAYSETFWRRGLSGAVAPGSSPLPSPEMVRAYRWPSLALGWSAGLASFTAAALAEAAAGGPNSGPTPLKLLENAVRRGLRVLIIHGELDAIVPCSNSAALQAHLSSFCPAPSPGMAPSVQLVSQKATGHLPHEENPVLFGEITASFAIRGDWLL